MMNYDTLLLQNNNLISKGWIDTDTIIAQRSKIAESRSKIDLENKKANVKQVT